MKNEAMVLDILHSRVTPRYAKAALAIFFIAMCASISIFIFTEQQSPSVFIVLISIKTLIFWWLLPLAIIYKIEHRGIRSLGLILPRDEYLIYISFAFVALILPLAVIGFKATYPIEFIEQILYIGFSEEVFYRGFLMTRICQWLGKYKGLLVSSFIFGLGHIFSSLANRGVSYFLPAISIGVQAFIGGLIFGYLYIRSKNIWSPVLLHVATNMYLKDLFSIFTN